MAGKCASREEQKKRESVGEVPVLARQRLAIHQPFGFDGFSVSGHDEPSLLAGRGRAFPQSGQGRRRFTFRADLNVDVIALDTPPGRSDWFVAPLLSRSDPHELARG